MAGGGLLLRPLQLLSHPAYVRTPEPASTNHHARDPPSIRDIVQRIGVEQEEVGLLPDGYRAQVGALEKLTGVGSRGSEGFVGSQPGAHKQRELVMRGRSRY